jgi:hypothetical protein
VNKELLPATNEERINDQIQNHNARSNEQIERQREDVASRICTTILKESESVAVILVLEDIHWADPDTLFVARRLSDYIADAPIVLVFTMREKVPEERKKIDKFIASFSGDSKFLSISLKPFTASESRKMLNQLLERNCKAHEIEKTIDYCDGNPLFLYEATRAISKNNSIDLPAGFSTGLTAYISHRLGNLKSETHRVLSAAAIIGVRFHYTHLAARFSSFSSEYLINLLEDAESHGFVESMETPGLYRFTHALYKDTLIGAMQPSKRQFEHSKVFHYLIEQGSQNEQSMLPELAYHAVTAYPLIDADCCAEWVYKAALFHMSRYAPETAQAVISTILDLYKTVPGAFQNKEQLADLFRLEGICMAEQNVPDKVAFYFVQAFRLYKDIGAVEKAVELAVTPVMEKVDFGSVSAWIGRTTGLSSLREEAVKLVKKNSLHYARLLAQSNNKKDMLELDLSACRTHLESAAVISKKIRRLSAKLYTTIQKLSNPSFQEDRAI